MSQKAKIIYRIICCYSDPLTLKNFERVLVILQIILDNLVLIKISRISSSFSKVFIRDSEPDEAIIKHENNDLCSWSFKVSF